jgi:hypothetical protein
MVCASRYCGVTRGGDVELAWCRGLKDSGDHCHLFALSGSVFNTLSCKHRDPPTLSNDDQKACCQSRDCNAFANPTADLDIDIESDFDPYALFHPN